MPAIKYCYLCNAKTYKRLEATPRRNQNRPDRKRKKNGPRKTVEQAPSRLHSKKNWKDKLTTALIQVQIPF